MELFLDPQQDWRLGRTAVITAVSIPLLQSDEVFWSHKARPEQCCLAAAATVQELTRIAELSSILSMCKLGSGRGRWSCLAQIAHESRMAAQLPGFVLLCYA